MFPFSDEEGWRAERRGGAEKHSADQKYCGAGVMLSNGVLTFRKIGNATLGRVGRGGRRGSKRKHQAER